MTNRKFRPSKANALSSNQCSLIQCSISLPHFAAAFTLRRSLVTLTVWCADAKICIRFGAVHTLSLYEINVGISDSLDDSGQKLDRPV